MKISSGKVRKYCEKRRKCWLPAFSSFPTMFSKGFLFKVVKSRDCVGKCEQKFRCFHIKPLEDNIHQRLKRFCFICERRKNVYGKIENASFKVSLFPVDVFASLPWLYVSPPFPPPPPQKKKPLKIFQN